MSAFTPAEIAYLRGQLLGRLATVGPNGQPHVVPVAFRYSGETDAIDIGGYDFAKRKKYRDVRGNPRVALVIDDVPSVNPWRRAADPEFRPPNVSHQAQADRQLGGRRGRRLPKRPFCTIAWS